MNEIHSINFRYLLIVKEMSNNTESGELAMGVSSNLLKIISQMSYEQIEELAKYSGVSLLGFRLREEEIEKFIKMTNAFKTNYILSIQETREIEC
ncbi:MAG TPA: hypothetical protein DEF07_01380 [Nitrosomonas sp.]|jgi:hypothetical protein|uniref:Uncharacterized protein n=1 Tax=Nitrosomonas mobilis TaxID=51642 RepID=A0A1G5SER7_9PROT|nr:flagellar transcriptional regulator FlhD [Nitrosomonas mobilis]SCZ85041.1 hypothetical protein NSMM_330061 [Nitrosomonas mobilis]HBV20356.1 hypothetical protein [Nitrosomonas sp.]HNO75911.1 flagellar transcriptional regulator FlhD [Nitrosomonas mobilis]